MDYLKKYISFNLFAFYGYFALGRFLYYIKTGYSSGDGLCFIWSGAIGIMRIMMESPYFLLGFLCEFIILFILSKIFKKKFGLNIKNKVYDILYRLGTMNAFAPIIIIISFLFCIFLGFLLPPYAKCDFVSVILYFVGVFDFLIKGIFFRKYFV